jgi:hypothetical protein
MIGANRAMAPSVKSLPRLLVSFRWQWCFGLWMGAILSAWPVDSLVWRTADGRVDAHIDSWNLTNLLQEIATTSGWQVYLEPGTDYQVRAKFKGFSAGEALQHLLGNLNYALLSQTNSAPKLFVYKSSLQGATPLMTPAERGGSISKSGQPISKELVVASKPDSKKMIALQEKRETSGGAGSSEPFKFEFDPSQFLEQRK